MTINISIPDVGQNLHPQITVLGVGGSGGNAVNNMINSNLEGVDFVIANTDSQALQNSSCKKKIQLGVQSTRGLGAGMRPDIGRQAAEETLNEIGQMLEGSHMLFIAAGMGGGTGTGAAPVIAQLAREKGILTVGVVTKPFHFEGSQRMKLADKGLEELQQYVDTLLTIPNQNLFRIANEKTTFADAFKMADDVLYAGVRGVTDLMVQPGLINLDFSDVKTVMSEMGKAMMGTGEASGEGRAIAAAEAAIANPLIDDVSLKGAKGLIINITGGNDITLYEVDEAANRIKQEVDEEANIIYGTTCDDRLEGIVRVSLVATGIEANSFVSAKPLPNTNTISIDNSVYAEKVDFSEEVKLSNEAVALDNINSEKNSLPDNEAISETLQNTIENTSSEEILTQDSIITDDEEVLDEQSVLKEDISSDNLEEELIENHKTEDEVIENNESSASANEEEKTSVRRLSLFDTLDNQEKKEVSENSEKTEPKIEENINDSGEINEKNHDSVEKKEFFPEEEPVIEEEFNQDQENEELLDIPTFLRRQAN
ncbi:cell division protein FtsZ [Alphaproteobacteria bacterium]|nr:cell division protein FtsZ [Alphaproteobacteria bacterium]